jgi:hypothetical protein
MEPNTLDSHVWSDKDSAPHEVIQDGKTLHHHRCMKCGRDFARELPYGEWQAAYLGAFRLEILAESVSDIWLTEECPGGMRDEDGEHRRTRRA